VEKVPAFVFCPPYKEFKNLSSGERPWVPEPLPPIKEDEISLICRLAVDLEQTAYRGVEGRINFHD
jgi:hypothetical protein